jgi:hypothetical protein
MRDGFSKTQPPPLRTAGGLFPHMADESDINIVAGRSLSSSGTGNRATVTGTREGHQMAATAERWLSSFYRR